MTRAWMVVPLVGVFTACGLLRSGDAAPFDPVRANSIKRVSTCAVSCVDSLDIVSLGVGGYLFIPWRDTTQLVMTPPFYSHPGLWHMAFLDGWPFSTRSNEQRVRERLKALEKVAGEERLMRVRAVLVGHAHYDHLMDLPTMAPFLPRARVFGSRTTANLLRPVKELGQRVVHVDSMSTYEASKPGMWEALSASLRFRAVAWEHAANAKNWLFSYTIATGDVLEPRTELPRYAREWKKGRVYAYELDVLDARGNPALRLIVNDAAAGPRVARRASEVFQLDPARSTVLITTAASFEKVAEYPELMLSILRPQHLVLGHWEDFFRSPADTPRIVRGTRGAKLANRLNADSTLRWSALEPGAVLRVYF